MHTAPETDTQPLLTDTRAHGVRILTLSRPHRGNALSTGLVEALHEVLDAACADDTVHTLVLRGAGAHFCTGFDLSDLETHSDGDLLYRLVRIELLLARIWHAPVRTIAVVSGRVWGAGADVFAACDSRVAAPDATFRFPGAGFGLVLGTRRLAERVGADRARRYTAQGLTLDARTAQADGLVTDVAADGDAWLAQDLAAPIADRCTVAQLRAATRQDRRDEDLAALTRSAARPGLKQRIIEYRERQRPAAVRPAGS